MAAVSPWGETFGRWREGQGPPGHNLGNETPAERRRRERTHRNPYFTEDFLEIIATIYEWQTVQRWMDGSHVALQHERGVSGPDTEEFNTPEKMKRALIQNGAEPWMFEELPPQGRERMAFFSEKSTPERRWRVFPYGSALKPWHIEEIRNNRDPFTDPWLDNNKDFGNPADWQDFAITDRSRPWLVDVHSHPTTAAPVYSFSLDSLTEPGTPWYGGHAIESVGFTDIPKGIWNLGKAGFEQRGRQRDEAMGDHAAAVRANPRYSAAYFAEIERIKNMSQEDRMALYDDAENQGFNTVFGTADILEELRPGHFTAVSSLGAMIPGTEAHKRDLGTAELGILPLGFGTESGVPQSRGAGGDIAERLAVAEAGEYMAKRAGSLQTRLENLEHERSHGRLSEEDFRTRSAELLHLTPPPSASPGGEAATAPTPTESTAPTPAPQTSPGLDLTRRKQWYEVD